MNGNTSPNDLSEFMFVYGTQSPFECIHRNDEHPCFSSWYDFKLDLKQPFVVLLWFLVWR